MPLTEKEKAEFLFLSEQKELEKLPPKFEAARKQKNKRIFLFEGGRGAGAKTMSLFSWQVQDAHRQKLRILCGRQIQESIRESSWSTIVDTIERLRYPGWKITEDRIYNTRTKSMFAFKGLKDLKAAGQIKSYDKFDRLIVDEAAPLTEDVITTTIPVFRKQGNQLFFAYNPEEDIDPIKKMLVTNPPSPEVLFVRLEPGPIDNPWWHLSTLQQDWDRLKLIDEDEAMHQFEGLPRKQGQNAVMSRVLVDQATKREVEAEGQIVVGCDPADFGDDKTQIYIRKGLKIIDHKELSQMDGVFIANTIAQMIKRDKLIPIILDATGIGVSARDQLKLMGLKVIAVHFSQAPIDGNQYHDLPTELWFNFKQNYLDKCQIPADSDLKQELCGRLYKYDVKNRYQIEPKKDFKERLKRSPDKADALLLCFYNPQISFTAEIKKELSARAGVDKWL